uniref:Uncharacterized protein n=1 Tax=Mustela putorius furo TaxID=9669 RepID=M3XY01_MUSPF
MLSGLLWRIQKTQPPPPDAWWQELPTTLTVLGVTLLLSFPRLQTARISKQGCVCLPRILPNKTSGSSLPHSLLPGKTG